MTPITSKRVVLHIQSRVQHGNRKFNYSQVTNQMQLWRIVVTYLFRSLSTQAWFSLAAITQSQLPYPNKHKIYSIQTMILINQLLTCRLDRTFQLSRSVCPFSTLTDGYNVVVEYTIAIIVYRSSHDRAIDTRNCMTNKISLRLWVNLG